MSQPVALTIAGSDPSGGAGLQADLKTFHQHQVYGMSAVTLLTVQNTQTVTAVEMVEPDLVKQQIRACVSDIPPQAAKTGALGTPQMISCVADEATRFDFPLVIDPVMISKHDIPLLQEQAIDTLVQRLLPLCFLVTPNIPEAEKLSKIKIDSRDSLIRAAQAICRLGARHVLIKGGHRYQPSSAKLDDRRSSEAQGERSEADHAGTTDNRYATDVLWIDNQAIEFSEPRIETKHTHGTGCVYSAAITAHLARGTSLIAAVGHAKRFITGAITTNPGLGQGLGPVNTLNKASIGDNVGHHSSSSIREG